MDIETLILVALKVFYNTVSQIQADVGATEIVVGYCPARCLDRL